MLYIYIYISYTNMEFPRLSGDDLLTPTDLNRTFLRRMTTSRCSPAASSFLPWRGPKISNQSFQDVGAGYCPP